MADEIEKEDEYALTAEYVLGLLTPAETDAYEAVLAVDPDLRDEYAFWTERMVALTDDVPPVAPPSHLLRQIKASLFHDAAETSPRGSWLQRLGLLPAMAGGLLAAVAVLWLFTTVMPPSQGNPSGPAYVAQIAAADQSLVVEARYDPAAGQLEVTRTAGAAATDRALELWLIAGDAAPVSLGVLDDAERTQFAVPADLADAVAGSTLAISDEPVGGSPTGQPTGAVLATGQVTAV